MKKNIIITPILIIFLICVNQVFAEKITIERDILEQILKRQNALEDEIKKLKQEIKSKDKIAAPEPVKPDTIQSNDVEILKEDVEEISDRLDTVEKKSILDKIKIGGELRARLDYFDIDDINSGTQKKDGSIDELWSTRFRLNLRSDITDNLIFHGRLSYNKYWGDTNYDVSAWDSEYALVSDHEGNLHVERAYIDYFVPSSPLSITIGRLPVSNGPPYEFKNNTTRKATWPQLFVEGEYDGIITNLNFEKWTGLKDAMFRLGYTKVAQNYHQYQGIAMDDIRAGFLSIESQIPKIKDSLLWLGMHKVFDLNPLTTIPETTYPEDSGSYEVYTAHLQLDNIMNTGLGWFGSFSYQNIHPRNEGTKIAPGYEVGLFGDSLHGDLGENQKGHAFYTGLRYILPCDFLKYPKIGFEYNYGSKYWLPGSISGVKFQNKLAINGSAYEVYYIQPINKKHMYCRLGAVYQDFNYYNPMYIYGSMDDKSVKSDMSIMNTYFLVDVRF